MIKTSHVLLAAALLTQGVTGAYPKDKTPSPPYPEMAEALKRVSKDAPVLILFRGEGWDRRGTAIHRDVWTNGTFQLETSTVVKAEVVVPDWYTGPSHSTPCRLMNFPLLLVTDSTGRPVLCQERLSEKTSVKEVLEFLKKGKEILEARNGLWNRSLTGMERAVALGSGFDLISAELLEDYIVRKSYDAEFKAMAEADPDDKSGYLLRYLNLDEQIKLKVNPKTAKKADFEAYGARLDTMLAENKRLTNEQRQHVLTAKYSALKQCRECKLMSAGEYKSKATRELEKVVAIDPASFQAKVAGVLLAELGPDKQQTKSEKGK